ncbi:2-polyprenyl-6-methoxyphenol hydroxylase-like oxidoreductase [Rhodococcus sp. CX]|uniref:FAD-dependent oxidoreductase n=1 Tax=Rhodococcus sp. CX TaxID=2789880 RepID=UPI0018CD66E3|nr:2-polyprenyl-6-methoxyphenol hydroxylase-like oxidoreductase [Rhodococcus sp. CX]MBH0121823.1 2-polyprenyl-6-methoxyphenol hydroxylase-like oxidoreductase [Rhodococcus sp. CX]
MNRIGGRAVVLGGSMGGLLAARALAEFYDTVTVVERDVLPTGPENRRGVPQGRHVHALLASGAEAMDELLPGLLDDLASEGVPQIAYGDMAGVHLAFGGHTFGKRDRVRDGFATYLPSRCFLQSRVRSRIRELPNVTILDGHGAGELTTTADRRRVTGVQVGGGGSARTLRADLVVDARGRGARTPAILEGLGYGRPEEEHLVVDVTYCSRLLRIPPGMLREKMVIVGPQPGRPTGMALFACENDTWMFTETGMVDTEPPTDLADTIEFVESFTPAHVVAALRSAEPLGAVARHRYPSSQWRHYERMSRFPAGLLVFGDAVCSFNPIYGQGMTVAALEALELRKCLHCSDSDIAGRFFRAAARPVGAAWKFAIGADLSLPEVEGPRPWGVRIGNAYVDRVLTAAETDTAVAMRFLRVSSLYDPPRNLGHPAVLARVCAANLRRRRPSTSSVDRAGTSTVTAH